MQKGKTRIKCRYPLRMTREMKDMILALPAVKCPAKIELVETNEAFDNALAEIKNETLLGFDTETRPTHKAGEKYPVSILQLSGRDKAWVFRLDEFKMRLFEIFAILEDKKTLKVGVGMKGDISGLQKLYPFNPAGFVHIEPIVQKIGIENTGLRNLTALLLGRRLSKAAQMSNWAAKKLDEKQIVYAGTDAWISRKIFIAATMVLLEKNYAVNMGDFEGTPPFSLKRFLRMCLRKVAGKLKNLVASDKDKSKANPSRRRRGKHSHEQKWGTTKHINSQSRRRQN